MVMVTEIIQKWYGKIGFSNSYDEEFYKALETYEIDPDAKLETYDINCEDGKKNFLYFLYFCEETEKIYNEIGIGKKILFDTLQDFIYWLDIWSKIKGELHLGQLVWMREILSAKIFRLGRLQFCLAKHYRCQKNENQNNVIACHIPAGEPLDSKECIKSFDFARDFFSRFYPEYHWEKFICHSWLLGEELVDILGENSNIVKFQKLFTIEEQIESDSILHYVFGENINRDDVKNLDAKSGLAKKVKELMCDGAVFHVGSGYINR